MIASHIHMHTHTFCVNFTIKLQSNCIQRPFNTGTIVVQFAFQNVI